MNKLMKAILLAAAVTLSFYPMSAMAAGGATPPPKLSWSFDGPFGSFDRKQLKRGWQVFKEVCAACHSIHQIYYRNLEEIGFSAGEVKKIAAEDEVAAGPNDDGETHDGGELLCLLYTSPSPRD